MPEIIAPQKINITPARTLVFLAGSIEMGVADDWQKKVSDKLLDKYPNIIIANPRREKWDDSWEQSIENPQFSRQVNWEMDNLKRSDLAIFYFQPKTKSPIAMMELGYHLARKDAYESTVVCCPDGFWRRGNIEVMMDRAGLGLPLDSIDDLIKQADIKISNILGL